VSHPTPTSRESLLALIAELHSSAEVSDDAMAAVRAAIASGLLGPPDEALVDDVPLLVWFSARSDLEGVAQLLDLGASVDAGHGAGGTALHAAVESGSSEMVDLLLSRGASPLAQRGTGESVLRVAHRQPPTLFHAVRRAVRQAAEGSPGALSGLASPTLEHTFELRVARGVRELRQSMASHGSLDVLVVQSELKAVARALGKLVQSPRREADVAGRPVGDAERLAVLYRLQGIDWTIVPLVFAQGSLWNIPRVPELAAGGTGIAPLARALASEAQSLTIHIQLDRFTVYSAHGGIETHAAGGDDLSDELGSRGVFVPPMSVRTDGAHVQLELVGIEPSEVQRLDVLVLQEFGDPAVDRNTTPRAAPARIGAPPLALAGQPAMVAAAPPPAPAKSAPPAMVKAPAMANGPVLVAPGNAGSEAPAMAGPSIVAEPPPVSESQVPEPPLATGSGPKSAPPPLVSPSAPMSEAPPIVTPARGADEPASGDES